MGNALKTISIKQSVDSVQEMHSYDQIKKESSNDYGENYVEVSGKGQPVDNFRLHEIGLPTLS